VVICDGAHLRSAVAKEYIIEINAAVPSRGWPGAAPGHIFDNPFMFFVGRGSGGEGTAGAPEHRFGPARRLYVPLVGQGTPRTPKNSPSRLAIGQTGACGFTPRGLFPHAEILKRVEKEHEMLILKIFAL
jgi:hypothetical protein